MGHVGLIEVDARGIPHIIEATPERPDGTDGGVIRLRYTDWLKSYTNIQVWHGRFRDLDTAVCQRVLDVARSQPGKPYDFFNFDLNDDRSFYCSKLVWMSVWRAAQIAADDNPDLSAARLPALVLAQGADRLEAHCDAAQPRRVLTAIHRARLKRDAMEARMRAARAGGSTATLQHHREQLDGAGCS